MLFINNSYKVMNIMYLSIKYMSTMLTRTAQYFTYHDERYSKLATFPEINDVINDSITKKKCSNPGYQVGYLVLESKSALASKSLLIKIPPNNN